MSSIIAEVMAGKVGPGSYRVGRGSHCLPVKIRMCSPLQLVGGTWEMGGMYLARGYTGRVQQLVMQRLWRMKRRKNTGSLSLRTEKAQRERERKEKEKKRRRGI